MLKALMWGGLLGASMAAYATDESFRLAHAKSENVEVFVDHAAGQSWCSPSLRMRFVFGGTPPEGAIGRLMPKLGGLLDSQCPQTATVQWEAMDGSGRRVAQGSANKVGGWATQRAAVDLAKSAEGQASPAIAAGAPAPRLAAQDVVGIGIGDTAERVLEVLEQHESKYEVKSNKVTLYEAMPADRLTASIVAEGATMRGSTNRADTIGVVLSLLPNAVVIQVRRHFYFNEGEQPLYTALLATFKQKYGAPSLAKDESGWGTYEWYFNSSGELIPKPTAGLACFTRKTWHPTENLYLSGPASIGGSKSVFGDPACGRNVGVRLYRNNENKDLAGGFELALTDAALAEKTFVQTREMITKLIDERKRKEVESARDSALPQL